MRNPLCLPFSKLSLTLKNEFERHFMENSKTTSNLLLTDERYRAEQRTMQLLDFVPYPMVVFKLDGRVNYVNPAFTEMFGWTLDELAGRHIPYVPPDLVEKTGKGIKKSTREKFIRRFETRRLTKDGRVLDVAVRVAVFSEGGEDDDA